MNTIQSVSRYLILTCVFAVSWLSPVQAQTSSRDVALDCGGWVSGFAQHSSGRLYGYGDIFGLYRSDDFGTTWQFLQDTLTENVTFVVGAAVSPTSADRVAFIGYGSAWTSLNGGSSWTKRLGDINFDKQNYGPITRGSTPILYHPTRADELWVASPRNGQSSTLWRSTNNGGNWSSIGGAVFENERATTIYISPSSTNLIWIGTRAVEGLTSTGGLWCSTNDGVNWTKVWNNNGNSTLYYGAPQVNSITRNSAGVSLFATNSGVFRISSSNWNNASTYTVTQATFADQFIPNVKALADGSFWCTEIGDQPWFPQASSNGINWADRSFSLSTAYVPEWISAASITNTSKHPGQKIYGRDMVVQDVNNSNRWLMTGGAAAHYSEDNGVTWRYRPGGMAGMAGFKATFDRTNSGRVYLASADKGMFVVDDGGLSGKSVNCSNKTFDGLYCFHEVMVSANGQTIIGAGVDQNQNRTVIIRSTDGGSSWAKVTPSGLPDSYEGVQRGVMSLNDPNDYLVLLGWTDEAGQPSNPGLYRTTNGGSNFFKVGGNSFDGINTGARYSPENSYLERDGINNNIRYLALRARDVDSVRGVWRSTDGGNNWSQRTDPFGGQWIWAFAVDPTVEGRLWVGGPQLRRSDNGGDSWTTVADFTEIRSLDAYAGRLVVRGLRAGDSLSKIYYSENNGASWIEQTSPEKRMTWINTVNIDPWRPGQTWLSGSRSWQIFNPPTGSNPPAGSNPTLTGSVTGSAPWSGDSSWDASKAYDGNTSTFFAPAANGSLTQLDLGNGSLGLITSIRFFPRSGFEFRMEGGRFEGSANGSSWTTLLALNSSPSAGWQEVSINNTNTFRYFRYIHPTGLADVAEIEFRGTISSAPVIIPPVINSGLSRAATVGSGVSYTITATNSPASYGATNLPAGLNINTSNGVISGTPTTAGTVNTTISASNSGGSGSATLVFTISAASSGANNGTGLRGLYYNNRFFSGNPVVDRTDSTVNFNWSGSPASGIGSDNFTVRWVGRIEAPVTGTYIISTETDDGVRIWVNGNQISNNWNDQGPTVTNGAAINLVAGSQTRIVMEYYENSGGATARLRWSYPGQGTAVIPQSRIYPALGIFGDVPNGSFESNVSQTPNNWQTWANSTATESADYTETSNPRIGSNNLRHAYGAGAYQVYTYQTVTGLTNGTYLVRCWSRSSGGQNNTTLGVSNNGGAGAEINLTAASSTYIERTLSVSVTNGQMQIGIWSDASAGNQWLNIDEINITRLP